MRKFLVISLSLLAFIVFSAKKCESPDNEDAANSETAMAATFDSIRSSFGAEHLSHETLEAFEEKAKQKLVDLADYLHIVSDKSMDASFKDLAREMIRELFISDNVHFAIAYSKKAVNKSQSLVDFLKISEESGFNSVVFIFDSIQISEPLHRTSKDQYSGSLKFSQKFKGYASSDTVISPPVSKIVDIIAAKVRKRFGNDTIPVWQVFLGNIY